MSKELRDYQKAAIAELGKQYARGRKIKILRERSGLTEEVCTDAELLECYKGSYLEALIDLNICTEDLKQALKNLYEPHFKRLLERFYK